MWAELVQPPKTVTWEPLFGFAGLWNSRMSPGRRSLFFIRLPYWARFPVHSFPSSPQAIDTKPEQSCRYPSFQFLSMRYGTLAATHFAARLMIADLVVAGSFAGSTGAAAGSWP